MNDKLEAIIKAEISYPVTRGLTLSGGGILRGRNGVGGREITQVDHDRRTFGSQPPTPLRSRRSLRVSAARSSRRWHLELRSSPQTCLQCAK
jgi:hypothetical protein